MEENWHEANQANWDERVALHLRARSYDLSALRAGRGSLTPIEETELGPVEGLRLLHLQCHFGRDSLTLAQRGADVTGLDFSGEANKGRPNARCRAHPHRSSQFRASGHLRSAGGDCRTRSLRSRFCDMGSIELVARHRGLGASS
jgi:hypothetical protein